MTNLTSLPEGHSRRLFLGGACALITSVALSRPALAHREAYTLSEITWEDNPRAIYATHSFHIHEAERALYKAGVLDKPDLYSLKSRAQLALYAEENFALKDQNGTKIDLQLLGAEISGGDCFVYQEAFLDEKPSALSVAVNFMRDLNTAQINHVDVKLGKDVQSLVFRAGDIRRKVEIKN